MGKYINLTGQRFGRLSVIERAEKPTSVGNRGAYWLCRCDCGNEKIVFGASLKNGNTKSCGCNQGKPIDLVGQRFGKLLVIKRTDKLPNIKSFGAYWLCKCDCGNKKTARGVSLRSGNLKSCGCLIGENLWNVLINSIDFNKKDLEDEWYQNI